MSDRCSDRATCRAGSTGTRGVADRPWSDRCWAVSTCRPCARPHAGVPLRRHGVSAWPQGAEDASAAAQEKATKQATFRAGWDEDRVRRVLEHYETQSDEEAVAEDEAAYEATTHTAMEVPVELVPAVRELIARQRGG